MGPSIMPIARSLARRLHLQLENDVYVPLHLLHGPLVCVERHVEPSEQRKRCEMPCYDNEEDNINKPAQNYLAPATLR